MIVCNSTSQHFDIKLEIFNQNFAFEKFTLQKLELHENNRKPFYFQIDETNLFLTALWNQTILKT